MLQFSLKQHLTLARRNRNCGADAAKPRRRDHYSRVVDEIEEAKDSTDGQPVFNRTVTLKDEWAKLQKKKSGK